MKLSEIKNLNQQIYRLDTQINRKSKVIFVATLIFCLKLNTLRLLCQNFLYLGGMR